MNFLALFLLAAVLLTANALAEPVKKARIVVSNRVDMGDPEGMTQETTCGRSPRLITYLLATVLTWTLCHPEAEKLNL